MIEEQMERLIAVNERLIHAIHVLTSDMEDRFMTEFSEEEIEKSMGVPALSVEERPTTEKAASIDHLDGTITPAGEKVIELIDMSKKMGMPYLYNDDGRLTVDNRVLDEYNRQHRDDRLG